MKKIAGFLILILVFIFVPLGWCVDGRGAQTFMDNFSRSYEASQANRRANEELELRKQELELRKKQQNDSGADVASPGTAKDITQNNGTAWNNFGLGMKLFYLYGFTKAAMHISIGALGRETDFNDEQNKQISRLADRVLFDQEGKEKNKKMMFTKDEIKLWGNAMLNINDELRNNILKRYMIPEATSGQIMDGLDVLYKDFKNVSISIPDAIYVVKKQINGGSLEEIEAILQYLRSDRDYSKLDYTDKDGKKKKAIFP